MTNTNYKAPIICFQYLAGITVQDTDGNDWILVTQYNDQNTDAHDLRAVNAKAYYLSEVLGDLNLNRFFDELERLEEIRIQTTEEEIFAKVAQKYGIGKHEARSILCGFRYLKDVLS